MVLATGRATWHVKNIAQALIYKAAQRVVLPTVEGQEGGKWIVIDSVFTMSAQESDSSCS
ncbi:hypothetical protein RchiOBHm_Chr3g0456071 [Rosa chinensis]|uniref:Uncharacterized protein n=1 Tax=Rosa chinensis TaxID=74649 RepID=A0A2P6R781_ROSCH|nr:hypothetical protein RchiOBHm_Chr3g0456071 [Rosa chinensis]